MNLLNLIIYLFYLFFSQFFYLITDLYKEGTAKDMKKWAYEIHSTYLVPNAVRSSRFFISSDYLLHNRIFIITALESEQRG